MPFVTALLDSDCCWGVGVLSSLVSDMTFNPTNVCSHDIQSYFCHILRIRLWRVYCSVGTVI